MTYGRPLFITASFIDYLISFAVNSTPLVDGEKMVYRTCEIAKPNVLPGTGYYDSVNAGAVGSSSNQFEYILFN